MWDNFISWLGDWFGRVHFTDVIVTIIIGIILYYFSGRIIHWLMRHLAKGIRSKTPRSEIKKRQKTLAGLFTTVAKVLIVLVVIFTVLSDFGLNLTPLLASAGVAGVALGFGAQSLVKDSISGFFIILENQYRVGDFIVINGAGVNNAHGAVEKVSIRSTTLRDREGNVHFIPNGSIVEVINKTLGYSKVHFSFTIQAGTDVEKVAEIVNKLGRAIAKDKNWVDRIIDPPHFTEVGKFSKEGYEVTVSGITPPADQWKVSSEFRKRLMEELAKEKIRVV